MDEESLREAYAGGPRFGPTAEQLEYEERWNPNWENERKKKDFQKEIRALRWRLKDYEETYESIYGEKA